MFLFWRDWMLDDLQQINIRLHRDMVDELKSSVGDGEISKFIREAITEKLNRKKISIDETYHRMKKLDNLDTESVRKMTVDIEFTTQIIYDEIKKQNELLKLIFRRASLACGFSSYIFNSSPDNEMAQKTIMGVIEDAINNDLTAIKF